MCLEALKSMKYEKEVKERMEGGGVARLGGRRTIDFCCLEEWRWNRKPF